MALFCWHVIFVSSLKGNGCLSETVCLRDSQSIVRLSVCVRQSVWDCSETDIIAKSPTRCGRRIIYYQQIQYIRTRVTDTSTVSRTGQPRHELTRHDRWRRIFGRLVYFGRGHVTGSIDYSTARLICQTHVQRAYVYRRNYRRKCSGWKTNAGHRQRKTGHAWTVLLILFLASFSQHCTSLAVRPDTLDDGHHNIQ